MFLGLLATLIGGVVVVGVIMLVSKALRLQTPRWVYPIAAGAGILGMNLYMEYSWFARTAGALPDAFEVIETFEYSGVLQPWTLAVPRINRLVALDHSSFRRNAAAPDLVLVDVYLLERFKPAVETSHFVDCEAGARAVATPAIEFRADGMPLNADWQSPEGADPVITATCTKVESSG